MAETNAEGLNIAAVAEAVQGASPPPAVGWLNLEADAVGDPGPDYKKMARNPFSVARQLRRPFVSGLDCALTLDIDAIKDHLDFFGEAIFKAAFKHSGGKAQSFYRPTAVTATGYTVAANGDYAAGRLFVARGLRTAANNGIKVSLVSADPAEVKFAGLAVEAGLPANAALEFCGIQGTAGDIKWDVDGNLTSIVLDFTTLGIYVDQFLYLPSQEEALDMGDIKYASDNAAYHGFVEVAAVAAHKITFRRRQWAVGAADPAADNLIRLFFTKWIRNVFRTDADERLVSHAFEVTYSDLAAGPADAYELLLGYMLDQVTFNLPAEGKVTMQMTFVGKTASDPSTVRVPGPNIALNVVSGLALSTSSDIKRLSIDNVDETGLMTDFKDMKIVLKNNIVGEKAVANLGNRFTPLGVFEAKTTSEVFLTTPDIVTAVRDNRVLRMAAGMRNDDFGLVLDIPSTGAMTSKKKIEHNKLITVSTEISGYMDANSGFTSALSMFAFLPTA